MSYASTVLEDSPTFYAQLQDTSGTTAVDSAASPHNGEYKAAPELGKEGPGGLKAVRFKAASLQFVTIANALALEYGDVFSLEVWLQNFSASLETNAIIGKGNNSGYLRLNGGFPQLLKTNAKELATGKKAIGVDGKFHHLVGTKNGASMHLWVDAVDETGATANATCEKTAKPLTIARSSENAEYGELLIAHAAVYAGVELSGARVAAHYAAMVATGASPLAMVI